MMKLNLYMSDDSLYVEAIGRIILDECERLKSTISSHMGKGINQIYINISNVDFIDSGGLGALVSLKMTASRNKARLVLLAPSKQVSEILTVSKLNSIFDIIDGSDAELIKASLAVEENLLKEISAAETPAPYPADEFTAPVGTSPVAPPDEGQKEQIDKWCRSAIELMRQGEYEKAAAEYQKVLEIDPEYLSALNNLAILYEKKPSYYAKAIEQWEKVLQVSRRLGDQKHIDRAQKHLSSLRDID
jgi:anti-sigma B factor antagonist